MGGIAWFGIPMGIATSMGLAAVALKNQGLITLTPDEVSAGLPAVKGMFFNGYRADKQPLPHLWDLLVDWRCFSCSSWLSLRPSRPNRSQSPISSLMTSMRLISIRTLPRSRSCGSVESPSPRTAWSWEVSPLPSTISVYRWDTSTFSWYVLDLLPLLRNLTSRDVSSDAQSYLSQCASHGNDVMEPEQLWEPSPDFAVPSQGG
jgi:hypothetical protein